MPTYLFSWNPLSAFTWPNNNANSAATRRGEVVHLRWSTGGIRSIVPGDRIFLGKLGRNPIGVIASGVAASDCFEDTHWADDSRRTTYNMVDFDTILDPEGVLPRSWLAEGALGQVNWDEEYGGIAIEENAAKALEEKWREWLGHAGFPQLDIQLAESVLQHFGYAGWIRLRLHMFLESNADLMRAKRTEASGHSGVLECEVCGVAAADPPGDGGSIECHDRRAISTLESTGDLHTAVDNLALVCRECHRVLHSPDWPSVKELRLRRADVEAAPPASPAD